MFKRKKTTATLDGPLTEESLHRWLVEELARRVETTPEQIDPSKTFEEYGLDSRVAVQVSGSLEKVVERRLSPGLLYEHESVDELTAYLAKELQLAHRAG